MKQPKAIAAGHVHGNEHAERDDRGGFDAGDGRGNPGRRDANLLRSRMILAVDLIQDRLHL